MMILLLLISFIPLIVGNDYTKLYATEILLFHSVVAFISIFRVRDTFSIMSPVSLIFFYTSLSLAFGAWGFRNGHVLVVKDMENFLSWHHMDVSLALLLFSLSVMIITNNYMKYKTGQLIQMRTIHSNRPMMLTGIVLIPFFFFSLDLDVLGGSGDLAIIPKTVVAIFIIIAIQRINNISTRWVLYVLLIIGFATFSIEDKREAIFIVLPAIYLELAQKKTSFSPLLFTWTIVLVSILLALILVMSVARGYGEFGQFSSLVEALPFVSMYISSDIFIAGLLANTEVNYFFFHALNAIEIVINSPDYISMGSTIIKPLFIMFPRSIAEWKPDSIIGLYTSAYDPSIRALGGSWPISIFSEFVWNFYYLAPLVVVPFTVVLVKFQRIIISALSRGKYYLLAFYLFTYLNLITLARGSGFDQFIVFIILGGFFVLVCKFFSNLRNLNSGFSKVVS